MVINAILRWKKFIENGVSMQMAMAKCVNLCKYVEIQLKIIIIHIDFHIKWQLNDPHPYGNGMIDVFFMLI